MESEPGDARTPPAIEQLIWAEDQSEKALLQKIEALLNEWAEREVRFLGIHHKKGRFHTGTA